MSIGKKHPSHTTHTSHDSSSYDEVCINSGAKDISRAFQWGELAKPCKAKVLHSPVSKYSLRSNIQLSSMLAVRANRLRGMKGKNVMTDFHVLNAASERLIVLNNRIKYLEKFITENNGSDVCRFSLK